MSTVMPPNNSAVTRLVSGTGSITLATSPIRFQDRSPWTIEVWFSLDACVDAAQIVSKANEFALVADGRVVSASLQGQPAPLRSGPVLDVGVPYCVCVMYDGLTMTLYVNGAAAAQATTVVSPPQSDRPFTVGGFYGSVQGLRLWTQAMNARILAANQFTQFPPNTPMLGAQIDFTVSPPADSSGSGVNAALGHGAVYTRFVPSVALRVNSFCDPYNDGGVNPAGRSEPFSVTAWICPHLTGQLMHVFANGVDESRSGMTLGVREDGRVFFQVGDSAVLTSHAQLAEMSWTFVAVTWEEASGAIYVDGALDASAMDMTLGDSLPVGEPLVGAIASVGARLPIRSFQGHIQSVCVYSVALSASDVAAYRTANPQIDPHCVAYYDLSQSPAQNQVTLNPLGLVAGAALAPHPMTTSDDHTDAARLRSQNLFAPTGPPPNGSASDEAFLADAQASFDSLLDAFGVNDFVRREMGSLHAENLRRGRDDWIDGSAHASRVQITEIPGGLARLTYTHPDGTVETISEGFDPCTMWELTLVGKIIGALFTAMGLAFNYGKFLKGFTNFFGTRINTIGVMPQLVALLRSGVTGKSIYASLTLLREYSLLMPLVKLSFGIVFASLSWWTILSIATRVLLLMTPSAVLEVLWLIAQLAYSVYGIQQTLAARPSNCP